MEYYTRKTNIISRIRKAGAKNVQGTYNIFLEPVDQTGGLQLERTKSINVKVT